MSYDVECPYCGAEQEICHDDGYGYEEHETYQQECSKCDKIFTYVTHIDFYYSVREAPCLNGGEHTFNPVIHYPKLYPNWVRCENCKEEVQGELDETLFDQLSKDSIEENVG